MTNVTLTVRIEWHQEEPETVEKCEICGEEIYRMIYGLRMVGGKENLINVCEGCHDVLTEKV